MANWIHEKVQNGEFITWEVDQAYTREAITVNATLADVEPGTVVEHAPGKFAIVINRVRKGRVAKTACIVRGAAIVILDLLIFPAVADGADAGTSPAEETAAKRAEALAYFDTKGVIARN